MYIYIYPLIKGFTIRGLGFRASGFLKKIVQGLGINPFGTRRHRRMDPHEAPACG